MIRTVIALLGLLILVLFVVAVEVRTYGTCRRDHGHLYCIALDQ